MLHAYRWLLTLFYFLYTKVEMTEKTLLTENNTTDLVSRRSWAKTAHVMGKGKFNQHPQTLMQLMKYKVVSVAWWMPWRRGRLNKSNLKKTYICPVMLLNSISSKTSYIHKYHPKVCLLYSSAINLRHPDSLFFCWWGIVLMVLFPQRTVPKFPMVSKGQQREIIIIKKWFIRRVFSTLAQPRALCCRISSFFYWCHYA